MQANFIDGVKPIKKVNLPLRFFYWGPFVTHMNLPVEFCNFFIEEGKKVRGNLSKSADDSLAGNLTRGQFKLEKSNPSSLFYLSQIIQAYCEAHNTNWNQTRTLNHKEWILADLWINYYKAGDYQPFHNHAGDISFVFFPEPTPPELIQEDKDFEGTARGPGYLTFLVGEVHNITSSEINALPKQGDLYIFPAHVKHMVTPYKSKVERCSISGNAFLPGSSAILANLQLTSTAEARVKSLEVNGNKIRYMEGDWDGQSPQLVKKEPQ